MTKRTHNPREVAEIVAVQALSFVAGDPERLNRARREREGIAIPATTWEELTAISARFGVALPG